MKRYLSFFLGFCLIFTTMVGCATDTTSTDAETAKEIETKSVENEASSEENQTDIAKIKEMDAYTTAVQAYIYGFAAVEFERTRRIYQSKYKDVHSNQFLHLEKLCTAEDREVVMPNNDTLYSSAFIDLSKEPVILHIPDFGQRYFTFPLQSVWTEVFANIGLRDYGRPGNLAIKAPHGGDFALVGPRWEGTLPEGVERIDCPSNDVWSIHRPIVFGQEDIPTLMELKKQIKLTPLSNFGVDTKTNSNINNDDMPLDADIANAGTPLEGIKFWEVLGDVLKRNPIPEDEQGIASQLKKIGLTENGFDKDSLDENVLDAIIRATHDAKDIIETNLKQNSLGQNINNWQYLLKGGVYNKEYLFRTMVAVKGLGMLPPEEAIYPIVSIDDKGKPLTGEFKYVIRFPEGQLPPVDAFWSITMYANDKFLVDNPIDRYAIGNYTKGVKYNKDGSLTIYIQHDSPGKELESNWLPASEGPFYMALRMYLPQKKALEGKYNVPMVERVDD